ncbi:MAG: chemotaxis protein CheB [Chlamydiota bacterium]|nr:chemotaxis protein CheB [Chlamydiota bacterium]
MPKEDSAKQEKSILLVENNDSQRQTIVNLISTISNNVTRAATAKDEIYIPTDIVYTGKELDKTFSLTVDLPVCYSRPNIDVLFESAAECYCEQVIGILLTGANSDGAEGLAKIAEFGGLTIVQNPDTATNRLMPLSGLKKVKEAKIRDLDNIIRTINEVGYV